MRSGGLFAYVCPRGIGPAAWTGDEKKQTQIRRRFMLLGQTLDGMRVWDIRRTIQALGQIDETRGIPPASWHAATWPAWPCMRRCSIPGSRGSS